MLSTFDQKLSHLVITTILGLSAAIAGAVPYANFDADDLVIRDGKNSARIPDILAQHAYYGTIHAVQCRGDDFFVVYGTSEMGRAGPRRENGEFGLESYIRWLHVRDGKIIEQQEGRKARSEMKRDRWSITWHHGKLVWITDGVDVEVRQNMNYSIPMTFTWAYDPSKPESGIIKTKKPRVWILEFNKSWLLEHPNLFPRSLQPTP